MSKCAECGSKNQDSWRAGNFWIIKQLVLKHHNYSIDYDQDYSFFKDIIAIYNEWYN